MKTVGIEHITFKLKVDEGWFNNKVLFKKPRIPRKFKKKLYGTKGRRKNLAKVLLEEKDHKTIKSIKNIISSNYTDAFPLSLLTKGRASINKKFNWNIQNNKI